jgi:type IV fimbrial biogenesis protein FimT
MVLGIATLLLAMAAPGFSRQRAQSAVRAATSQTMSALHLARRLALARGQSVTVCPSEDGRRCGFSAAGWVLFANDPAGSEATREDDEPLLRSWQLPSNVTVSGSRGYASFKPRPGAATTVTFEFRHTSAPEIARSVVVSQTGRPRVTWSGQ